ncbi:CTP-dependent riboflavin kinase [Candidatus Bathyarchaeota archaeon]|nr:CTP-dependent riboflavin kinase [Candidatus Bathyarchaeota archaeon]
MDPLPTDKEIESQFFTLYNLAELGARDKTIKISTKFLAEKMGLSQQTISRRLIELEKKGLIQKTATRDGCLISLTKQGENQLKKVYTVLSTIFEQKRPVSVTIEGTVFSGLGEGAYYVTRPHYRKQFNQKLGFDPYPGTLNIKITNDLDLKMRSELDAYDGIMIEGYTNQDRTYGAGKCFKAIINNREKGAVVIALRTHYDNSVIEVLAPTNLRQRLNLKDGHKVKLEVYLTET